MGVDGPDDSADVRDTVVGVDPRTVFGHPRPEAGPERADSPLQTAHEIGALPINVDDEIEAITKPNNLKARGTLIRAALDRLLPAGEAMAITDCYEISKALGESRFESMDVSQNGMSDSAEGKKIWRKKLSSLLQYLKNTGNKNGVIMRKADLPRDEGVSHKYTFEFYPNFDTRTIHRMCETGYLREAAFHYELHFASDGGLIDNIFYLTESGAEAMKKVMEKEKRTS